jgi:hypothetical protein
MSNSSVPTVVIYTGEISQAHVAWTRAKQGGDRVRPVSSRIASTNGAAGLVKLFLAAVADGDKLNAQTIGAKGKTLNFWKGDTPTEGTDYRIKPSGREYANGRISEYLNMSQDARMAQVLALLKGTDEATADEATDDDKTADKTADDKTTA